jgi:hypothetical protein
MPIGIYLLTLTMLINRRAGRLRWIWHRGQQAVEPWPQQGMPLEAITAPKRREVIGSGRYPTMTAYLRPIRGESPGVLDESEDPEQRSEALPQPGPRPP